MFWRAFLDGDSFGTGLADRMEWRYNLVSRTGLDVGDLVHVRYWGKEWIGKGTAQPDFYGHHPGPGGEETTRIYLHRTEDRGYDVLIPNGFEAMSKKKQVGQPTRA